SSALLLTLDKPLEGAAAVAILAPEPLELDVSTAPATAAWAAQWLSRQGVPAVLAAAPTAGLIKVVNEGAEPMSVGADRALSLAGAKGVMAIAALRGAVPPASYGRQWPLPVEALTTDLLTHTFRGSSRWSLRYKLADLPDGSAPGNLSLSLRTSLLQEANQWTLRVLLNGSLIHSANYPGAGDTISLDVPLPPALQGLTNEIVVTLVDNTPNQGICRAGPEAAAQLLPESRLDASPAPADDKQALVKALATAASVAIPPESGAGLPAAEFLTGMLDLILPLDTETTFAAAEGSTTIEVVNGERLHSLISAGSSEGARNAFLVVPSSRARPDGIAVLRLAQTGSPPASMDIGPNALLVTW
ncbi:MAG TPA: cellulose biosynthesis cyclic di-GMP-binding regulatory protein BcsB, partial [Rhizobiaceae bacterium]